MQETNARKNWAWVVSLGTVFAVAAGIFWYASDFSPQTSQGSVAIVNDEAISRSDFDAVFAQLAAGDTSQVPDQEQVLNQMIDELLLYQDARAKGIKASEEEIQQEFDQIAGQFESEQEFQNALDENGVSRSELRKDIERQLVFAQYIGSIRQEHGTEATDEEVLSFYEASVSGQENGPELEEVRLQIAQQIEQQKIQQVLQQIVQGLRAEAEISRFL